MKALGIGIVCILLDATGVFEDVSNLVYDEALRSRGQLEEGGGDEIVLVAVTDEDVARIKKPFPWPRDEQAVIIEKIADEKPSVVTIDFIYAEPSERKEDERLGGEIGRCEKSVGAFYFDGNRREKAEETGLLRRSGDLLGVQRELMEVMHREGPVMPIETMGQKFSRLGHVHVSPDDDGVVRRTPLLVSDGERLYPSMALQAVLLHLGVEWSQAKVTDEGLTLVNLPQRKTMTIPLDESGQMLIAYTGDVEASIVGTGVWQMVAEDRAPEMEGKIVFVGSLVTGHGDIYATPVAPLVAGAMINATIASSILRGDFIREASRWQKWIAAILAAFLGFIVIRFLGVVPGALAALVLAGLGVFGGGAALSVWGYWLAPTAGVLALLGSGAISIVDQYGASVRARRDAEQVLSRYLGPRLAELAAPQLLSRGSVGERKEVTVFFSDIVDYTVTSERLQPEEIVKWLNQYFDTMSEIAFSQGGTVNKFMGDGLMVFFNDPVIQPDHARRCYDMAISMTESLGELNDAFEADGLPRIRLRMGAATGYVTVGNIGSKHFWDYTVVGETVNLAARLMGAAPEDGFLVNELAYRRMEGEECFEKIGQLELKGISRGTVAYSLVRKRGEKTGEK